MPASPARRPRILLGNLEPMTRLGMSRVLVEGGMEVVVEEGQPGAIVAEAKRLLPDAIVLALDDDVGHALSDQVRAAAPGAKVILWARDETQMEVFEPGASRPRRIESAVPDALLSELGGGQATRQKE